MKKAIAILSSLAFSVIAVPCGLHAESAATSAVHQKHACHHHRHHHRWHHHHKA